MSLCQNSPLDLAAKKNQSDTVKYLEDVETEASIWYTATMGVGPNLVPRPFRLQFLIACSMHKQREKAQ